jgi:hypothetical protein
VSQSQQQHPGLVVAGYVMLFVLPPGAVVAGVVLDKSHPGHAVALSMLGVLVMLGWALLLVAVLA